MASGKSLELAAIGKPKPSFVCICGASWNGHMRKDGKGTLKAFSDPTKHTPVVSYSGSNRAARRAARRSS